MPRRTIAKLFDFANFNWCLNIPLSQEFNMKNFAADFEKTMERNKRQNVGTIRTNFAIQLYEVHCSNPQIKTTDTEKPSMMSCVRRKVEIAYSQRWVGGF